MSATTLDLILVRHGVTDWNEAGRLMGRCDVPLNARGCRQAQALAEALRDVAIQKILASPQRRAQETAACIAQLHDMAPEVEADLAEVWVGRWQGKAWAELRDDPAAVRYVRDPTQGCDAVEALNTIRDRVTGLVERLRQAVAGSVVLVSHGDPLRVLLSQYVSVPLGLFRHLEIAPGSLSVLRLGERGARLLLLNWRPEARLQQLLA